jgi:hypothetical protein
MYDCFRKTKSGPVFFYFFNRSGKYAGKGGRRELFFWLGFMVEQIKKTRTDDFYEIICP